jgi:hypothetical protein
MTTPLTPEEERRMREWMVAHPDAYTAKCIGMLDAARERIAEFEQVAFAHHAEMAGAEEHIAGLHAQIGRLEGALMRPLVSAALLLSDAWDSGMAGTAASTKLRDAVGAFRAGSKP